MNKVKYTITKVKYTITYAFGNQLKGDVVDAYLLAMDMDSNRAIIFHLPTPSNVSECGSIELCYFDKESKTFKSLYDNAYVNVKGPALFELLKV